MPFLRRAKSHFLGEDDEAPLIVLRFLFLKIEVEIFLRKYITVKKFYVKSHPVFWDM